MVSSTEQAVSRKTHEIPEPSAVAQPVRQHNNLYKTSLCQYFMRSGNEQGCPYGNWCIYAHGPDDLLFKPNRTATSTKQSAVGDGKTTASGVVKNNMYKTSLCRSYLNSGTCFFGERCLFAHGVENLKPKPSKQMPSKGKKKSGSSSHDSAKAKGFNKSNAKKRSPVISRKVQSCESETDQTKPKNDDNRDDDDDENDRKCSG